MKQYHDLIKHILANGVKKDDRTGTGTLSVFGYQMRFDLNEGFPLVTTKKIHIKSVIHELLWMLSGDTNTKYLEDNGVTIWREWTLDDGTIGKGYGYQWRNFGGDNCVCPNDSYPYDCRCRYGVDQISNVIEQIKSNPDSRRHLVTAWNPQQLDEMALPPCHYAFQFYVADGKLSLMFNMRSCDVFLGNTFNIAFYAALKMMVAQVCDLKVGELIVTIGDAHIYLNHIEQCKLQITRDCRPLPRLHINPDVKDIFAFKYEDFTIEGYDPHPHIAGKVAV